MATTLEYDAVLRSVTQWPLEQRASLANALIDTLQATPRVRPSLDELVGIARGQGEAPTDEQVDRWLEEHRTQKYGG